MNAVLDKAERDEIGFGVIRKLRKLTCLKVAITGTSGKVFTLRISAVGQNTGLRGWGAFTARMALLPCFPIKPQSYILKDGKKFMKC